MGEEEKKETAKEKENEETKKPKEEKKKTDQKDVAPISPPNSQEKKKVGVVDESKEDSGPSPQPQEEEKEKEIILKVYMHCEGCARKVRRCLKGFEGVEDVVTDTKAHTVVVKGEKADPLKVLQRLQDKLNHRQVDLLSPKLDLIQLLLPKQIPLNPPPPPQPQQQEEEKKEVISVMLNVHMHCEACAQEIRRRIQKMQGVESATADLKTSEVVVKGSFEPPKLIDFIRKRTGKHALIVKVEPEEEKDKAKAIIAKEEESINEQEKKDTKTTTKGKGGDKGEDSKKDDGGKEKEKNDDGIEKQAAGDEEGDPTKMELKKSDQLLYNYYPQAQQYYHHQQLNHQSLIQHDQLNAYPPQMFSDENPNSCSVM